MRWPFLIRRVQGESMQPFLSHGQLVMGRRNQPITVGAVVIISHGGLEKIKRVDRLLGSNILVLGDNPTASTDSRQFGWISKNSVQAIVIWPHQTTGAQTFLSDL